MKKRRLFLLLSLGVLLTVGGLGYRHYWLARPVGRGPAGPAVDRNLFEETWTTREVLLLGVGDSVTAGFGASPGRSYFERLARNPEDEFSELEGVCLAAVLPNLRVENEAISGSTSIDHLEVLRERLETQAPETLGLVVMTTGGNDIIHMYGRMPPREGAMYGATLDQARPWIDNFDARLDEMLDLLEERFPGGCHVFLADIYDPTDGIGDAQNAGLPRWGDGAAIHRAYNEVIHRCTEERSTVHLVPMHGEFLGHGIHCVQFWREHYRPHDPHYWYADNLEDPNDRGYDAIRRLFLLAMAKVSGEFREASDLPHE
jgi:lysophospholipase L1-like esterase